MNTKRSSKNNKRQRKINSSRSKRAGGLISQVSHGMPFPPRWRGVLSYNETYALTQAASTLGYYTYYQTSAYDPRGGIGGHQPLYYDQVSTIYGRYRVIRIDWTVTVTNNSAGGAMIYVRSQPTTTADTSPETLAERPNVVTTSINAGSGSRTLRGFIVPWKILGISRAKYYDDPNYSATVTANPAIMVYLFPMSYANEATSTFFKVDLRMHCEFFEQQVVTGS